MKKAFGAAFVTVALLTTPARAADEHSWPVFRGNALQTGVAVSPLPSKLEVCWTFKAKDSIDGTASIFGGTVYFGSFDEHVYALDLRTGQEKWHAKIGPVKVIPSYHDGRLYVGNTDGLFVCLDAATGQAKWKFEAGAEITSGANFAGQTVLFGSADENLYCLSDEGQLRWKFKVAGGPVLASPPVAGDRTFVSGCDSSLHVLDLANGREILAVELEGQTASTPAVVGDYLYVGTMSNQVVAVDWKKGTIIWKFEPGRHAKAFYASSAANGSLVIAASRDRNVYALERKTGKEIWHFATGGNVDGSPVIVGDRVFAGSLDGALYVLDLATGELRQKIELGTGISASPAVADNYLVIGTNDGALFCLGQKAAERGK